MDAVADADDPTGHRVAVDHASGWTFDPAGYHVAPGHGALVDVRGSARTSPRSSRSFRRQRLLERGLFLHCQVSDDACEMRLEPLIGRDGDMGAGGRGAQEAETTVQLVVMPLASRVNCHCSWCHGRRWLRSRNRRLMRWARWRAAAGVRTRRSIFGGSLGHGMSTTLRNGAGLALIRSPARWKPWTRAERDGSGRISRWR